MDTVNKMSNPSVASFVKQQQLIIFFVLTLTLCTALAMIAVLIGDETLPMQG
ncbi:MAG: hypothetical protein R2867_32365 [Caldilineaceae bacterium]